MINNDQKEQIALQIIRVLKKRFDEFPRDITDDNRNAPFHKAFLEAFTSELKGKVESIPVFISLSSWMHGLNTSLGQTFFEKVAHILSDGEKKGFTSKKKTLLKVTDTQKNTISNIITDLKNGNKQPDLDYEDDLLVNCMSSGSSIDANDFTCDVFFEDNGNITAIELKSVRPNSGESRGEKQKILEAKAALFKKYPDKQVAFYVGFPFDPTDHESTGCDKKRFLDYLIGGNKYFDTKEVLLASELWNFLSDDSKSGDSNTMKQLLDIINAIATPKFLQRFNYINTSSNRHKRPQYYRKLLERWYLFSEIHLFDNDEVISQNLKTSAPTRRWFHCHFSLNRRAGKYR